MSKTIEISRELAEKLALPVADGEKLLPDRFQARAQLSSLLAAPVAERQEPLFYVGDIDGYGCLYSEPTAGALELYLQPVKSAAPVAVAPQQNCPCCFGSGSYSSDLPAPKGWPEKLQCPRCAENKLPEDPVLLKPPFSVPLKPGEAIQETSNGWMVLPQRDPNEIPDDHNIIEESYAAGWNACLDKVKELNQ